MPSNDSSVQDEDAPAQSKGSETETSSVGIWGIVVLSLVLGIAVFVLMMRSPQDDELFGGLLDEMGEPDAEGLLLIPMRMVCFGGSTRMENSTGGTEPQ